MLFGCTVATTRPTISHHARGSTITAMERANQLLVKANTLDYSTANPSLLRLRFEASTQHDLACEAGEARACILAMALPHLGDDAMKRLGASCRAGHRLSCRAVSMELALRSITNKEAELERMVGHWYGLEGLTLRCGENHPNCNWGLVLEECSAGWPSSCYKLSYWLGPAFRDRAYVLAREGCEAGIVLECYLLGRSRSEADQLFRETKMCWYTGKCEELFLDRFFRGELVKARDALELDCQTRGWSCSTLAGYYMRGELPEPVPGRGRQLLGASNQPRVWPSGAP